MSEKYDCLDSFLGFFCKVGAFLYGFQVSNIDRVFYEAGMLKDYSTLLLQNSVVTFFCVLLFQFEELTVTCQGRGSFFPECLACHKKSKFYTEALQCSLSFFKILLLSGSDVSHSC